MCGIAAIVCADGKLGARALEAMTRAQTHRGPDDEGFEYIPLTNDKSGPVVGLAQRRLSIIDLSPLGHQPMVHPQTGDSLTYNGELYNFQTLRERLERDGIRFRGHSDTEVLLHALVSYGADCLKDLAGMYALVFYHRATRRVLIARDPMGIKPLYVASTGRSWMVASEVRAILASGQVPAHPDPRGLAGLIAYGAVQEPFTFFKGISAFPAGCFQWITTNADGSVKEGPVERYWSFPAVEKRIDEKEAKERLGFELDRAVREHLIADVPVGVFLSSGLDSTIITGLAKRHSPSVRTFTVGFADQPDMAESAMARETARLLGVEHHDIQITGDQSEAMTVRWLDSLDQPSIDGLNTYVISKAIRDAGVVVALSGLGGDELFAGYPSFSEVPRLHRLARSLGWLPPSARAQLFWALAFNRPASIRSRIKEMGYAGADLQRLYFYRRRAWSDEALARLGISADKLGLDPMFIEKPVVQASNVGMDDPVAAVSRLESQFYMGNTLLRDSDANGMAHSLEIRVPMLDTRVMNLAYSIPGRVRAPGGVWNKHLLRATFPEFLRPEQLGMVKKGFSLPIKRWMTGPLRPLCEQSIDYIKNQGILEPSAVQSTWQTFIKNPEQQIWSSAFLLCVLGKYLQRSVAYARPVDPDVLRISPGHSSSAANAAGAG